jgi:hypothetical protein
MRRFTLEEMREMAKTVFLKAVSAVDPYQRLKTIARIDKNRLIIGEDRVSEKVFNLNDFEKVFLVGT